MKRLCSFLAVSILCALIPCCTPFIIPGGDNESEDPGNQEESVDLPGDLSEFEKVSLHSEITHVQPMTGIVLWNENSNCTKPYVQLEFEYMLYSDVCKERDVYDWSPMERLLESAAARGHQVVVRFRYTYPGYSCAVPAYIKKWPGYEATNGKSEGDKTEFPDWRCEELQRFHMEFHRIFAERYDKDPRLAFVETGFGLWAEYHIYDGPFILGRTFPSKEFQSKFLKAMDGWFKETPWMISIDAADDTYSPFESTPDLLKLGFGNFDDSFMCEDHDGYNYESWAFFGTSRYKIAPLGGEFSYYTNSDQKHCLDKAGMHGRKFEDEVAMFHMTFIIGNDQPEYQSTTRITEAAMSMGYRFEIRDCYIKEGEARMLIANTGAAPIYRDAYVSVGGKRGSYSLKKLMPGKEIWVRVKASGIDADSPVAIECDHLVKGQKGIEFVSDI